MIRKNNIVCGYKIYKIACLRLYINMNRQVAVGLPPYLHSPISPVPAFVVVFFSCFYMLNKNKQVKCLPAPYTINLPGSLVYCLYKYYIINLLKMQPEISVSPPLFFPSYSLAIVSSMPVLLRFANILSFSEKNGPGVKIITAEIKKSFFNIIT